MQPDKNELSPQPLNYQASREWVDLTNYVAAFQQFPAPGMTMDKYNLTEPAPSINRYPAAAARVNQDGLVLMRGLLMKNSGNIATGDIVLTVPKHLRPRHPQELRFFGGTCVLALDPQTWNLKVDILFNATSWINLGNVIYYID